MKRTARIAFCFIFVCGCRPGGDDPRPEASPAKPSAPTPTEPPLEAPPATTSNASTEPSPDVREQPPETARSRLAAAMWNTTLGRMYSRFLFSKEDRERLPNQARGIVERILSDNDQTASRLAAMHIMNDDIRLKEQTDHDITARIAMLEDELNKSRHKIKSKALTLILGQIPFILMPSLVWGSPLIRKEIRKQYRAYVRQFVAKVRKKEVPPRERVPWSRIKSAEALEEYEVGKALSAFSKTFGSASVLELLMVQKAEENAGSEALEEELALVKDL